MNYLSTYDRLIAAADRIIEAIDGALASWEPGHVSYSRGLDVLRIADRQAACVRFAAIALAAGLTAFLLAVVAGVIV